MTVINKNPSEVLIDANRFKEMTGEALDVRDVLTGVTHSLDHLVIPAKSAMILERADFQ
jgi:hypothetical protein